MASPEQLSGLTTEVLSLPEVTSRRMFGALAFLVQEKMFALLWREGVVVKLPDDRRDEALRLPDVEPFRNGKVSFGNWVQLPGSRPQAELVEWIRHGYDWVRVSPPPRRKRTPARSRP